MLFFEFRQVTGAEAQFRRLRRRITDFRPVFPRILGTLRGFFVRRFASEGAYPDGNRWQALTDSYAARKEAKFPGRKILARTGLLRESLTRKNARYRTQEVRKTVVRFGTRVPYAVFHQEGTSNRVPRRPILPDELPESFLAGIKRQVRLYILGEEVP